MEKKCSNRDSRLKKYTAKESISCVSYILREQVNIYIAFVSSVSIEYKLYYSNDLSVLLNANFWCLK